MKMKDESQLVFLGYVVKQITFINKREPEEDFEKLELLFKKDIVNDNSSIAHVSLSANIFDGNPEDPQFKFETTIIGKFDIGQLDPNLISIMLNNNCLAIMFPFLRALISTYTTLANVNPILIPAVNIASMFPVENVDA